MYTLFTYQSTYMQIYVKYSVLAFSNYFLELKILSTLSGLSENKFKKHVGTVEYDFFMCIMFGHRKMRNGNIITKLCKNEIHFHKCMSCFSQE